MFRREFHHSDDRKRLAVGEREGGSDITITIEPSIIDLGIAVILVW